MGNKKNEQFAGFIQWVKDTYPQVNQQIELVMLNQTLLYKWQGFEQIAQSLREVYGEVAVTPGLMIAATMDKSQMMLTALTPSRSAKTIWRALMEQTRRCRWMHLCWVLKAMYRLCAMARGHSLGLAMKNFDF